MSLRQINRRETARVHLNLERAKHSGRQFISENQRFTAGMLRPYEDIYQNEMHPTALPCPDFYARLIVGKRHCRVLTSGNTYLYCSIQKIRNCTFLSRQCQNKLVRANQQLKSKNHAEYNCLKSS